MPVLLAVLAGVAAALAPAAAGADERPRKVESRLVSEVAAIRPGEPFWVALHQRITPGWYTYW